MPPPPKTNRREFLSGKSAITAIENVLPQETAAANASPASGDSTKPPRYLLQVGRQAMACDFDILLNAGEHPRATDTAVAALDLIDRLEAQMTIYRQASEVIGINERAAHEPVIVEPRLFDLLTRAVAIHQATGGAFDITSGALSRAWGFFRRAGRFPTHDEIADCQSRVGSQYLELDDTNSTIRFKRPGIEINVNAIGKGYALDRCAELLLAEGVDNFLIHGGLSSILAHGSRAIVEPEENAGWVVALRHPYKSTVKLAELRLQNEALGTSGSANQFFHFNGKRYGHILDPRTGFPADKVLSTTVLAPDGATADALATAFFVLGVEESLKVCYEMPRISVVFVCSGERLGDVRLVTHGLRDDQLQLESDRTGE